MPRFTEYKIWTVQLLLFNDVPKHHLNLSKRLTLFKDKVNLCADVRIVVTERNIYHIGPSSCIQYICVYWEETTHVLIGYI